MCREQLLKLFYYFAFLVDSKGNIAIPTCCNGMILQKSNILHVYAAVTGTNTRNNISFSKMDMNMKVKKALRVMKARLLLPTLSTIQHKQPMQQ